MAARVIKTHPKSGTVSRAKIRAAVRRVANSGRAKHKKGAVTRAQTASGRGRIAFRKLSIKSAA